MIKLLLRAKGATPVELIARPTGSRTACGRSLGSTQKGREVIREEHKGGGYAYRIVADKAGSLTQPVACPPFEAASTDAVASADAAGKARASGHDALDSEDT